MLHILSTKRVDEAYPTKCGDEAYDQVFALHGSTLDPGTSSLPYKPTTAIKNTLFYHEDTKSKKKQSQSA